ncbi:F420-dependent glucose-6-phosphate dehydrogenase [Paraconexibacter sp. AEG42_29]|uniref:F420-dependent glucose-6-phosphate dehydrogenase n=1 Tax=Paraconexibacter sp. AEG42_29 TaxID=2997339 RepID=A0AAU7B0F0_9ACTN
MRIGITIPSRTIKFEQVAELASHADAAGFDSVWDYEVYRNPFTMLCTAATTTSRIQLGTGLAAAFSRSPFEAANAAADVDELSEGRMLLGIGTGVPEFLEAFHSTDGTKPLARMREYLHVLRLSWEYLQTGAADTFEGTFYRFAPPPINPWGVRPAGRERIPVYLAAMRPKMMELAGETAEGWLGYLATPKFIEERVVEPIAVGAARAGRSLSDIDIAADVICSVSPDREAAMRLARINVGFYVTHPVSDVVCALHGVTDEQNAVRHNLMTEGLAGLEKTSEKLVELFSISGTPEEARQQLDQYRGVLPHVILHTPYVPPIRADESLDAFANILDAFGGVVAAEHTTGAAASS